MTCSVNHCILLEIIFDVTWVVALGKNVFTFGSKKFSQWHFLYCRIFFLAIAYIHHNLVPLQLFSCKGAVVFCGQWNFCHGLFFIFVEKRIKMDKCPNHHSALYWTTDIFV